MPETVDRSFLEECFVEFGNFFLITLFTSKKDVKRGVDMLSTKTAADCVKALAFLKLMQHTGPLLENMLKNLILINPQGKELLVQVDAVVEIIKQEVIKHSKND